MDIESPYTRGENSRDSSQITGLHDLLGVGQDGFKWERALLFFFALFTGSSIADLVREFVNTESIGDILEILPSTALWYQELYESFLMTVVVVVSLFAFRRTLLALPVIAVFYIALVRPLSFYLFVMHIITMAEGVDAQQFVHDYGQSTWGPAGVVSHFFFPILVFGSLAVALRVFRHWRMALIIGSVAAAVLVESLWQVRSVLRDGHGGGFVENLLYWLGTYLIFALVLVVCLSWGSEGKVPAGARRRLPKGPFVAVLATSQGLSLIFVIGLLGSVFAAADGGRELRPPGLVPLMICTWLVTAITLCTLIYRMWSAIQDGEARMSPGKAVGLLFVPLFNFYWVFQVFAGFATDYNRFCERQGRTHRMGQGLAIAYPVLTLLTVVPVVNLVAAPTLAVVMVALGAQICEAVGHLDE